VSPYAQARRLYELEPEEHPFEWYWNYFAEFGFAFSTPDYFIIGRAVPSQHAGVSDCANLYPRAFCDAWFIHMMAGNLERVWDILPYPLPLLGYERCVGGVKTLSFVPLERMRRLATPIK
jgi:hypothetical protein